MRPLFHATRNQDGVGAEQIISGGRQVAGGQRQDIHEESETQNYTIGARLVIDDRVFRYCRAKVAVVALKGCCADLMPREGEGDAVVYAVGDKVITIPMNEYGKDYTAEKVAGYWDEGYVWIQTSPMQMYRIKSSAVATAVGRITTLEGGYVDLTLYEGLKTRMTASMWNTAWANPYNNLIPPAGGKVSIAAVALRSVTEGYYFWGQTWGPCFGVLNGSAMGRTANDRMVYFASDGSVQAGVTVTWSDSKAHNQQAGFLITNTQAWTNSGNNPEAGGDQFYMLQLSP
jgi:hypothetical protein